MKVNNVRITLDDHGKGRVWIDGVELAATSSLRIEATANAVTLVTIQMLASVEFEGNADVLLVTDGTLFPEPSLDVNHGG